MFNGCTTFNKSLENLCEFIGKQLEYFYPKYFFMRKAIVYFLLLLPIIVMSQNDVTKIIKAKIITKARDLESIYIINLRTEKDFVADSQGNFTINAIVGDTIMFSGVQIVGKKIQVKEEDFTKDLLFVNLEPMMNKLDEVVIVRYDDLNAFKLGIISKPAKKYTPAERRLYTAKGTNQIGLDTRLSLDGIINAFSGRTAMLKKELEIEKKELVLKLLEETFEVGYFTNKLKIPADYVKGFMYYLAENQIIKMLFDKKNNTLLMFRMSELATKYIEIINEK